MTATQTYQLSPVSHQLRDMQPQIVSMLSLKEAYRFFRTCTDAYNRVRPSILARLPEWFINHVVGSTQTFDEAAKLAVSEVARCPSDARFAALFLRLFESLSANPFWQLKATDVGIASAALGCDGRLTSVELTGSYLSDAGLCCIASNRELTKLVLTACEHITDTGLEVVAQRCKELATVSFATVVNRCNISSRGVTALITHCPKLTSLDISCCSRINDEAISSLATGCCPKLATFVASGCKEITDVGLFAIAEGCTHLAELNVAGSNITDSGVSAIAKACTNLTRLCLSNTAISDESLIDIAKHSKNIKELVLRSCNRISDIGVRAVLNGCDRLLKLALRGSGASAMEAQVNTILQKRSDLTVQPPK